MKKKKKKENARKPKKIHVSKKKEKKRLQCTLNTDSCYTKCFNQTQFIYYYEEEY